MRSDQRPRPQPHEKKEQARDSKADRTATGVVPKGGVRAGAEGVSDGSSDRTPMPAAGGGIAAAGAAGLGSAMLRRRDHQR
ncbi:hypothetical protein ACFYNY_11205 [Streptomyces sp. NPDC006530]|uniref:hypothetical protein n=1 Tax=Streptomyces sp. NPDC006530 TaxID=3364750 RepID=UPI003692781B